MFTQAQMRTCYLCGKPANKYHAELLMCATCIIELASGEEHILDDETTLHQRNPNPEHRADAYGFFACIAAPRYVRWDDVCSQN